mgnify:CR=1 FL=1
MKKISILIVTSALFIFGSQPLAASAVSVKNGVICSKVGATKKIGAKIYRCSKNPYVKPTQYTWTLRGCLTAYAMWKDAKEQFSDWIDLAKLAGPDGQKTMDELQDSIAVLENTMINVACKSGS